jgi:hypothetical protein
VTHFKKCSNQKPSQREEKFSTESPQIISIKQGTVGGIFLLSHNALPEERKMV